jgi:TolB protein
MQKKVIKDRSQKTITNCELRLTNLKSKIVNLKSPLLLLLTVFFSTGHAKVYVDINAPAGTKLPVAIADIKGIEKSDSLSENGKKIREVLVNDMELSGLFDIIDKKIYIEDADRPGKKYDDIDFKDWQIIGAEALIKGALTEGGDELTAELKLFDVFQAKMLVGKRYISKKASVNIRAVAHKFANEVMLALTGEGGIFDTKLLFVSNISGAKEIFMSDYDGYNARQITRNKSINLSPQWSPDSKKILYTSYKEGQPYLYMLELATGRETRLSSEPGLNVGARWSPSGKEIALTLSKDGNPELYILELDGMRHRRLTKNWAIDVSPTWSPDGKRLAFVSDMGGNPHIYMINSDGAGFTRLTFEGKYNAAPAWSPVGDKIAFSRMNEGRFDIWIMNADGTGQTQLTSNSGDNESPSWSPDGRYIVFASTRGGKAGIYIMLSNGENQRRLMIDGEVKGSQISPAWSPH